MDSLNKLFIICLAAVFVFMIAVGFMMNAKSISQEDIESCNDPVCANSINKEIANEEIMNQTNMTHHSIFIFPKP